MEVSHNFDIKLTPLLTGKSPESLKRCPKCQSFYLTDSACEACGYQLAFDGLGEPFSDRSYHMIVANFYEDQNLLFRLFPRMVDKNIKRSLVKPKSFKRELKFLNKLSQRFSTLSDYFLTVEKYELSDRKLYLVEWRELCLYLLNVYGEAWVSSKLDELIVEKTKASKVNLLMGFYSRALEEYRTQPREEKGIAPKTLNYTGALLLVFIASISALALMKYYSLMGR